MHELAPLWFLPGWAVLAESYLCSLMQHDRGSFCCSMLWSGGCRKLHSFWNTGPESTCSVQHAQQLMKPSIRLTQKVPLKHSVKIWKILSCTSSDLIWNSKAVRYDTGHSELSSCPTNGKWQWQMETTLYYIPQQAKKHPGNLGIWPHSEANSQQ